LWSIGLPGTLPVALGSGDPNTSITKAATVEHVVVIPITISRPGHAMVASSCHAAGLKVKVVELPGLPNKGDVSDFLDAGHTRDELVALVKATPIFEPQVNPSGQVNEPAKTTADKPNKPAKAEKAKQGRDVQFEDPEPWADPVQGDALLEAVAGTFNKFGIACPCEHRPRALGRPLLRL
jgi:hypothetical protein